MRIIECEQGSPDWHAVRCGVPSASSFDKIVTTKGERSKQRQKYLYQLAGERVSGQARETFQSVAMQRGVVMEAEARDVYQFISGNAVDQVGFCLADGYHAFGCSPDGLIGQSGGLEIKCPEVHTHVEYLLIGQLPTEYFQQVQGSLFVTGRAWWDFCSYYPGLRPLIVRVHPDKAFHDRLHAELVEFCIELEETINKIK